MIPYYNCKDYIAEAVESVEQQTYAPIEIIIVDDGSAPEHADYLRQYLANKPHIRYAVQNNQGVSAARNHAARLAQGSYFLFLDADDIILPDYVAKGVAVLEANPNYVLTYPQAELFGAQSGLWEIPPYEGFKSLLMGNKFPSSISMHRAASYQAIGGFDENLNTHEDWDYWIRMLQNGGEAYQIPEVLFRYRKREDQSSLSDQFTQNRQIAQRDWQRVYEKNRTIFLQHNLGYLDCVTALLHMDLLQQHANNLEQINLNLTQNHNNILQDNSSLQQQNQELTSKIHLLRENIMSFEQQNQALQDVLSKLLQQSEHSAKQTESLQQQIDAINQRITQNNNAQHQLAEAQQTIQALQAQIQVLTQEKEHHAHTAHNLYLNHNALQQRLTDYNKSLMTVKTFKPFVKIEQGLRSANRCRKGFRQLVREKGSIGKAYQHIRHMYLDNDLRTVKQFLRSNAYSHLTGIPQHSSDHFDIGNKAAYQTWIAHNDVYTADDLAQMDKQVSSFAYRPKISVLMPVYNVDTKWLKLAIDSVREQVYENWELCIADDASPNADIRPLLEQYMKIDARIKVVFREKNGHISENSNSALALAEGEWLALMDHDDVLPAHALFEIVKALQSHPDASMIYTDEDKIDENGVRFMPHFKSDFNLDLLYGQNYISHLGVYKTDVAKAIGGFRKGLEGSQDYDFLLRYLLEMGGNNVVHIPKILYHWRAIEGSTALASGEKSYTTEAGIKALQHYFSQLEQDVTVTRGKADNLYRVQWHWSEQPLVSLIIPTRNGYAITKQAIDSILDKTEYQNYEILLVDNNSDDPQTLAYFDEIAKHPKVTLLRYPQPFNYSAINNFAAKHANGSIIGLINNDIEVINPEWLTEMVSQVQRPSIGCVGAMLYYPNDTIQHAGVFISINGVAAHSHKHYIKKHPGYFSRLYVAQDLLAVTAACLLVRKEVFDEVGGLNEQDLTVAFNDVDFCLKVHAAGYRNLWTPYAELYHHESISRGHEDNPEKQARFKREIDYMIRTWHTDNLQDPYYNPNLTIRHEDFSIPVISRVKR
ncbi:glycosyltransferase [Neisseria perflava]|uniref:glycosyltransferase n=1 Tax=Neisseria perflava TaxID=33053 RepID=UPI00209EFD86|nr:glycosyltransferase [Neisseria perflava]